MLLNDWERLATTGQVQPTRTGPNVSACARNLFSIYVTNWQTQEGVKNFFFCQTITSLHLICSRFRARAPLEKAFLIQIDRGGVSVCQINCFCVQKC